MKPKHRILIVDDDETALELLKDLLTGDGYIVESALTVQEANELLKQSSFRVLIADLKMPDQSGMELLKHVVRHYPETQVIMLTAHGTIESAVEALKKGAFDYLTKPVRMDELRIAIEKAIAYELMTTRYTFLKEELYKQEQFLYETRNPRLLEIYRTIETLRNINSTVLLLGESGTGKEIIARYIHSTSLRASGSFVPINCGAIPENLIESELFGYEKGAFTDAKQRTKGKLEIADGGTLFLDEIDELPLKAQVALLRFLQDREVIPLGSYRKVPVDVRIVAATNQDLKAKVDAGTFREDLFYRINVIPIHLPPLRERKEDILSLAEWFLKRFQKEYNRPAKEFTEDAKKALLSYHWPGNIRELRNCIDRASILETGEKIDTGSLLIPGNSIRGSFDFTNIGVKPLQEVERAYIHWVLDRFNGNRTRTAKHLGISVRGLRYKLNNEEN
ncbi:MAG: hypothetical protein DRP87_06280 [Spirochaetes bacterium]|nr:MAG: hypothetical protein DRP87_06280 [Spirochaetota bacterium]